MTSLQEPLTSRVRRHLAGKDVEGAARLLSASHPAEVTQTLDALDGPARRQLFERLPRPLAASVLFDADSEMTLSLANRLSDAELAALLNLMPPDNAADILDDLPSVRSKTALPLLETEQASLVRTLLSYPSRSVGRVMTDEIPIVEEAWTAGEAMARLAADKHLRHVTGIYIVDEARRLVGVVSLRRLAFADPGVKAMDLVEGTTVSVPPETSRETAARMIARYNFMALPVVDASNRILGLFTVDDAMDVLVDEGTEDALRMGGVEPGTDSAPYWAGRITATVRRRFWWLLLLFATETLTGTVLRHFESELAAVVALSFYIPLLIGTGGNAGSQTVSTVIRGLAVGEIHPRHVVRVFLREAAAGFLLGMALGTVGFFRTLLWHQPMTIAATVGITLVVVCTWANSIGSLIPLLAARLKVDPAIMSAPLIATLVDATGLFFYFKIAHTILHLH